MQKHAHRPCRRLPAHTPHRLVQLSSTGMPGVWHLVCQGQSATLA